MAAAERPAPTRPPRPPRAAAGGAPRRPAPAPVRGRGGRLRARRLRRGERRGDQPRGGHVEGDVLRALRQQGGVHPRAVRRGGDRGHARDVGGRPTTRATRPTRSACAAGVRAFLATLAVLPDSAQTLLVEIIGAGPRAAARRDAILEAFADVALPRQPARRAAVRRADVRLARRRLRGRRRVGRARRRAACAPAGRRTCVALEPVITRLMLGVLQRAARERARQPRAPRGGGRRAAGAARGSWRGASRSRARSARRSPTRSTGAARSRASATRPRACSSSAWPPPPTAATAPAASSPATARATCSSPRCTARASPTSRPRVHRDDGLRLQRRLDHRRRALRAAGQQADARRSATTCLPWTVRRARAPDRPAGRRLPRRLRLGRRAAPARRARAIRAPRRGRASATRRSSTTARGSRCSAAFTPASRTRSPAGSPSRCSTRSSSVRASSPESLTPMRRAAFLIVACGRRSVAARSAPRRVPADRGASATRSSSSTARFDQPGAELDRAAPAARGRRLLRLQPRLRRQRARPRWRSPATRVVAFARQVAGRGPAPPRCRSSATRRAARLSRYVAKDQGRCWRRSATSSRRVRGLAPRATFVVSDAPAAVPACDATAAAPPSPLQVRARWAAAAPASALHRRRDAARRASSRPLPPVAGARREHG